jgi:hypothetical protein
LPLKKQNYTDEEIPIFDEASIYKRGAYWHFRMWLNNERKDARKSLRTRSKTTAIENGEERKLEIPKRLWRWWTEQQGGAVLLKISYGNKLIELEKGKNAIELSSKPELAPTLQSIKKAVNNGEFDTLLEEQLAWQSLKKIFIT